MYLYVYTNHGGYDWNDHIICFESDYLNKNKNGDSSYIYSTVFNDNIMIIYILIKVNALHFANLYFIKLAKNLAKKTIKLSYETLNSFQILINLLYFCIYFLIFTFVVLQLYFIYLLLDIFGV